MSIISGSAAISVTGSSGFYDFPIGQSLMFDGSSYLSKQWGQPYTSQTMTYSLWVKFSDLSVVNTVLWAGTSSNDSSYDDAFDFYQNKARVYTNSGSDSSNIGSSTALFRDISNWYHFVMTADSTNGMRVYVNGGTSPILTVSGGFTNINFTNDSSYAYIGAQAGSATFRGYMAEINLIDGLSLSPASFGETKNGVWVPKDPSGLTYGTNGFRLTFENDGTTNTISGNDFVDQSTNSNNWTANGF